MTWQQILTYVGLPLLAIIVHKRFPFLDEFLNRLFPQTPTAPSASHRSDLSRVLAIAEKAHGIEPPKAPSDVPQSFGATVPFEVNLSAVVKPKS